jgi:phosphoribosylformylglycinamidine cyclo-ligase
VGRGPSYRAAGVDVAAGDRAVELIRRHAAATRRPEVVADVGGFGGLFAPRLADLRDPVLVAAADGVGSKVAIAQALDRHEVVGVDLVAMVVDDLVCHGAEPLFLLDYIACGRLVPERIERIVAGIAAGCREAGCALLGGETAEHPGLMDADAYDVAGFGVGVVERDRAWGPERVREGDAVVGIASSGLHANGFSLVRRIVLEHDLALEAPLTPLGGRTLGDELLAPTRIYAPALLALAREEGLDVHAAAHVTGGGIAANLARVLPPGLEARLAWRAWPVPPIFPYLAETGGLGEEEQAEAFNLGIGMTILLPEAEAERAVRALAERGHDAFRIGSVRRGDRGVVREERGT